MSKMSPASGARTGVRTNSLTSDLHSPPVPVYHNDSRPSNIISPPIQKFPKLSPDSGFPGSPDLMDTYPPHVDSVINKSLGKLPGHPDVAKYQTQNPSIIKHTDPRAAAGLVMHQRPSQQPPAPQIPNSYADQHQYPQPEVKSEPNEALINSHVNGNGGMSEQQHLQPLPQHQHRR